MIACSLMLRDGYNTDAEKNMIVAPLTSEDEKKILRRTRHPYHFGFEGLGLDYRIALTRPVAVGTDGAETAAPIIPEIPQDRKRFITKDDEKGSAFLYDMTKDGRAFVSLRNSAASLFTGFVEEGQKYPFRNGTIQFGKTNLGWATVSLARGADKNRCLLVATGQMLNTDMKLEPLDEDKITVGNRWGKDPVRCEGVPATVNFVAPFKSMKCWTLDESGNRKQEVVIEKTTTGFSLELKPEYKTIWYEIETVPPSNSPVSFSAKP